MEKQRAHIWCLHYSVLFIGVFLVCSILITLSGQNSLTVKSSNSFGKSFTSIKLEFYDSEIQTITRSGGVININGSAHNSDQVAINRSNQRIARVQQVCQSLHLSEKDTLRGHGNFYAATNLNVVMMSMAKCGTTNLLNLLCMAKGPPCSTALNKNPTFNTHRNGLKYFHHIGKDRISNISSDYRYVFTVVRNPWTRLVSAWIDKFIQTTQYRSLCGTNKHWAQFDREKISRNETWTFQDFVEKCVIDKWEKSGPNQLNNHWRPQHLMGSFCAVKYNFIASTETLSEDTPVLLKEFGIEDVDGALQKAYSRRRPAEKKHETTHLYNQTWTTVSKSSIEKLKLIYAKDLSMFGYSDNPL